MLQVFTATDVDHEVVQDRMDDLAKRWDALNAGAKTYAKDLDSQVFFHLVVLVLFLFCALTRFSRRKFLSFLWWQTKRQFRFAEYWCLGLRMN